MHISCRRIVLRLNSDLKTIYVATTQSSDQLSELEILIVLLEDRRFFLHRGIDLLSVAREIFKVCTFQKFGGASTIDMQFVRMRTGYRDRTLRRKIYEMLLAYSLQSKMGKTEILRAYMQEMFLGSGIYGVENAARVMFNKFTYELDRRQAAVIAAMMVYPRPFDPSPDWEERVKRRSAYGLKLFDKLWQQYKRR
jgi:monofunctional glycosyltransferase